MAEGTLALLGGGILTAGGIASIFGFIQFLIKHRSGEAKREREENAETINSIADLRAEVDFQREWRIQEQEDATTVRGLFHRHCDPDLLPPRPPQPVRAHRKE